MNAKGLMLCFTVALLVPGVAVGAAVVWLEAEQFDQPGGWVNTPAEMSDEQRRPSASSSSIRKRRGFQLSIVTRTWSSLRARCAFIQPPR